MNLTSKIKMSPVDIGFAEPCEQWQVESRLFPSKIGGKPAWLDLSDIPNFEDLVCQACDQPTVFLCQVYAPYEEDEANFHRTLFIFVCRTATCRLENKNDSVKVFRSSLRRNNIFYSFEPPQDKPDPTFTLSKWIEICSLCGCKASKHCSKCKEVAYCCRQHQVIDWKENHKNACGKSVTVTSNSKVLFAEYEIIVEPEELEKRLVNEEKELEKFELLASQDETGTMNEISEADLQAHSSVEVDKVFAQFRKRVQGNPEQVLRYERGGEVLWIASEPRPDVIPDCEYCGGPRQFELQVMPQILTVLQEPSLDWGVLAVYTCKSSCTGNTAYKREYVFKQDVSDS